MTGLDELRADFVGCFDYSGDRVLAQIDAFEAAHPGLVDTTAECERCHKPFPRAELKTIWTKFNAATLQATFCQQCAGECDMSDYYGIPKKSVTR